MCLPFPGKWPDIFINMNDPTLTYASVFLERQIKTNFNSRGEFLRRKGRG
jgi:hypothetical protein